MSRALVSRSRAWTARAGVVVLSAVAAVTCGKTSTAPTSPSDLTGTWVGDGGRTWTLAASAAQSGQVSVIQVAGSAVIAQDNHPVFGSMSAKGGVLGTMVVGLGGLNFAEDYEGVSTSLFPFPPNDCYINTEGQLTVSGNVMTGVLTEHDGCNGVRLRDSTVQLVMRRQ